MNQWANPINSSIQAELGLKFVVTLVSKLDFVDSLSDKSVIDQNRSGDRFDNIYKWL